MSFKVPSRAKMTTATSGIGTLTLVASTDASLRSFQQAVGSGPIVVNYMIALAGAGVGLFEYGSGTFTSPTTLTRDTVIASSNGNALVNLPTASTFDVFLTWHNGNAVDSFSGAKTQALADAQNTQLFTGGTAANYTLLKRAVMSLGFQQMMVNGGTANLTLVRDTTLPDTIDGVAADFVLPPGSSCYLYLGATGDWRVDGQTYGDTARTTIANVFFADQTIESLDSGSAVGPGLSLYRNSASPAANDFISHVNFDFNSSAGTRRQGARLYGNIVDPTDTSEDMVLRIGTITAGTLSDTLLLGAGVYTPGAGGDMGVGSVNAATYFQNGVQTSGIRAAARISISGSSAVIQQGQNVASVAYNSPGNYTVTFGSGNMGPLGVMVITASGETAPKHAVSCDAGRVHAGDAIHIYMRDFSGTMSDPPEFTLMVV